jgi:hypothetical protein
MNLLRNNYELPPAIRRDIFLIESFSMYSFKTNPPCLHYMVITKKFPYLNAASKSGMNEITAPDPCIIINLSGIGLFRI